MDIIKFKEYPDLDEAGREAAKETVTNGGQTFLVSIFKQGTRHFISTVFPVSYIVNVLQATPTEKDKGINDVRLSMNRPLDLPHAKNTKEYIRKNFKQKYIIPSMTLNIQEPVNVYVPNYTSPVRPGYMVIPYGIKLSVTDGQHRKKALEELYKELPPDDVAIIKNDGISVMITVENNIDQIHQDFADCSKSKELPKSLIAVYDKRNPANSLVIDLIDHCPLFTDKVDATSNTLSKKSTKLLLVSQVRSFVKELLTGSSATGDVELEQRAYELYESSDSDKYKKDIAKYISFTNKAAAKIQILQDIASIKESIHMTKIPLLREKYLILNSAGLNILGRIGHHLLQDEATSKEIDRYIDAMANIDWKKSGELWQGSIVVNGARGLKIATSNSSMKAAVLKVEEEIGLKEKQASLL